MNMKNLIQKMTDIENANKEQLNEAATISISAETGAEIADMIAAMQGHAGVGPKPVPADMPMPMRTDIDKFRAAMDDDPKIPGRDDVEGDQDLNAGLIGALAGGALGSAAGAATGATGALAAKGGALGAKAGGALAAKAAGAGGWLGKQVSQKAADIGSNIGKAVGSSIPGAAGAAIGDKMTDNIEEDADPKVASMIAKFVDEMDTDMMYYGQPDVAKVGALIKQGNIEDAAGEMADAMADQDGGSDKFDMVMQRAQEYIEDYMDDMDEGYDNEPEPEYQDHKHMTKDLSGGINREKKMYAKAQDGDNALAVETIKAALMKALSEKKKPDANKNGIPDYAEDGKGPNDLKKKKKTNEAEFKKTGRDGDGSAKFDEMGCKEEMKKLNASGCAKMEMYKKVHEKYGCSKGKFEKLYASNCN